MAATAARAVAKTQTLPVRHAVIPGTHFAHVLEGGEFQPWRRVSDEGFPFDPFRISISIRRLRLQGMATGLPHMHLDIVDADRHFSVVADDVALAFHGPEEGKTEMGVFLRPGTSRNAEEKGQAIVAAIWAELKGRRPDLALLED